MAGIKPVGRPGKGKEQLRRKEAQQLTAVCLRPAPQDDGALAVLTLRWTGLRSGELLGRVCRDVDGDQLWITDSKTATGERRVMLPPPLDKLLAEQAKGYPGKAWLFPAKRAKSGHRTPYWLRRAVERLSNKANVPVVCPHGLRWTHATLATQAGASALLVAQSLGHASQRVTEAHYTTPQATSDARQRAAMAGLGVVNGGRK